LQAMTQADGPVLQRMLEELAKSLEHEHDGIKTALACQDFPGVMASLHRLKGICCLVDALPLAKACVGLEGCLREQRIDEVEALWRVLNEALAAFRVELGTHLSPQE
jgi:two-component system, NarL family, sensor histidine kinase EvgS